MEPQKEKRIVSKIPNRKQAIQVTRAGNKEEPPLNSVVVRWVVTMSICLCIWAVVSPIFFETVGRGNGEWALGMTACIIVPLLLASVSSTRKVIVKTRDQYFPPTHSNNADLPIRQTLVRASSEPPQEQQAVLLRAAGEGQETPPEQLVRPAGGPE